MPARLVIADDHVLFAQAVAQLLGQRYVVVDIVGDGRALQTSARTHHPDVIIADVTMPLMSGLESIRLLRKDSSAKIIFLTMHADTYLARECFNCGGSAFVTKESSFDELLVAIETVMMNQTYLSRNIAGGLIEALRETASAHLTFDDLTSRQLEVLQLFAEGKTMKEIALVTKLSTRTVEWHKYRIMKTLGVRRSAELVHHAVRMKLVA